MNLLALTLALATPSPTPATAATPAPMATPAPTSTPAPAPAKTPTQALVVLDHSTVEPATSAIISTEASFHTSEAPAKTGTPVLALCGDQLKASTLVVTNSTEFPPDDEMPRVDVSIKGCSEFAFFIVGDVGLKPGPVKRTAPQTMGLKRLDLPGGASLRREGDDAHYALIFDRKTSSQVLVDASGTVEAEVGVVFVGDLNGDGHDDVVATASTHYNVTTARLFLSNATGTLREVAHFTTTGC